LIGLIGANPPPAPGHLVKFKYMHFLKAFEIIVNEHSLLPNNSLYNSNALCGEAGEVANVIKKLQIRAKLIEDNINISSMNTVENYRNNLYEELGDTLFYLTRLALDNNITLLDLFRSQILKLENQDEQLRRTFLK